MRLPHSRDWVMTLKCTADLCVHANYMRKSRSCRLGRMRLHPTRIRQAQLLYVRLPACNMRAAEEAVLAGRAEGGQALVAHQAHGPAAQPRRVQAPVRRTARLLHLHHAGRAREYITMQFVF